MRNYLKKNYAQYISSKMKINFILYCLIFWWVQRRKGFYKIIINEMQNR